MQPTPLHREVIRSREKEIRHRADRHHLTHGGKRPNSDPTRSKLLFRLLAAIGSYQVALGAFMIVFPGRFFELIGPYGLENDHYTRDAGTFTIARGIVLLAAAWRPRWRVIAVIGALVQYVLHATNHLFDIGATDPDVLGPVNFVLLAAGAVVLGWMLATALRNDRLADCRESQNF